MSQSEQSNPATLREALRKLLMSFDTKIEQHLNKALDEGRVKPDFRTGAFYVLHELADLLAASGTEAAPTKRIIVTHPSQMSAEALDAGAIGEYVDVPAQAAASPEGEGREAFKVCCAEARIWIDTDCVKVECPHGEASIALRQSAAPSGVDLREAWFEYLRSLAQESKTGAVTEPR